MRHELVMFAEWMKASGKDITQDVELFVSSQKRKTSTNIILDVVSDVTGVSVVQMISKRRTQSLVFARSIAMKMFRIYTALPLKEIGLNMGGRDHTTVLHSFDIYEQMYLQSRSYREMADECIRRLELHYLTEKIDNLSR